MRKIFAIRIGDHIEFRAAVRPPQAVVSKLTKFIKTAERQLVWDPKLPGYAYSYKPVIKKLVLKQVFFNGGKVLGICKLSQFSRRAGNSLLRDSMREVPRELKDACLKRT